MGIYNLQQSSQQAEDALSQGMDALQQSLSETLANGSPNPSGSSGNVANYMGQMAMAMGKLGTLEGFLRQVISCLPYTSLFQMAVVNISNIKCLTRVGHRYVATYNIYSLFFFLHDSRLIICGSKHCNRCFGY